jgi:hypothetical protein
VWRRHLSSDRLASVAGERGQATLEYVGLVALVAVVLGLGALVGAGAGEAVAGSVGRGMQRALCVVRGGECDLDRRPCVVGAHGVEDDGSVDLWLLRVGSDEVVLREDRSDGTSAVTFARLRRGGLALSAGIGGHLRIGRRRLRLGSQASATVLALLGRATTWELPDRAAAARLVDRIVVDGPRDLGRRILDRGRPAGGDAPRVASRTSTVGAGVTFGASASAAGLTLGAEDLAGASVDAAGRRTYLVRRSNTLTLSVGTRLSEVGRAGGSLDELYTVTTDRGGRPVDLGILRGGELQASADLPRVVQPAAGFLNAPIAGARRWEAEEHLDLTEPDSLAAARGFLAQVVAPHPHPGRAVAVSSALRRALDAHGVLDARAYAVDERSSGVGAGARGGVGPVGADYERRARRARLVAAVQRGPDGLWRRRDDCLAAAGVGAGHGAPRS